MLQTLHLETYYIRTYFPKSYICTNIDIFIHLRQKHSNDSELVGFLENK